MMFAACPEAQTQIPPPAPVPGAPPGGISLAREPINVNLTFPLFATAPPGDAVRLFVVEKGGAIKIVNRNTGALIGTFLDIADLISTGSEQGLLGLAFDPQYAVNRRFYVSYTNTSGTSVIARYLTDPVNPNLALEPGDRMILTVPQPFANHNGGMIAFGPDNLLYIGLGDGGSGNDPGNRAQNAAELLGKLLRIDVSQATQAPQPGYAIPPDNPCVGQAGAREEIWSIGLRNPWRYSFDRLTGDLYIADVGQGAREEVSVSTAASGAGRGINYGWKITEGTICLPGTSCSTTGLTLPVVEYDHGGGACSITGGYVYRGADIPDLRGTYFYADFCVGFVRSFRLINGIVTQHANWSALSGGNITSFGQDAAGELYIMTSGGGLPSQGGLFRIVQQP
jgi:glucose/arabinose dehydrogenase